MLLQARLAAIYDLSREMTLSPDVDRVAETAVDIAGRVLEFEICDLWLVDEENACGAQHDRLMGR